MTSLFFQQGSRRHVGTQAYVCGFRVVYTCMVSRNPGMSWDLLTHSPLPTVIHWRISNASFLGWFKL